MSQLDPSEYLKNFGRACFLDLRTLVFHYVAEMR